MVERYIRPFNEELAVVVVHHDNHNTFGFINENGDEAVPVKYTFARDFKGGFAEIHQGDKVGFLNTALEEYFFEKKKEFVHNLNAKIYSTKYNGVMYYKLDFVIFILTTSYCGTKEDVIDEIKKRS